MRKGAIIGIIIGGAVLFGVLVVIVIAVGLFWFAQDSPAPRIAYNDPPLAEIPGIADRPGEILVEVATDGSVSVEGETLDMEALIERLKPIAAENPDQPVRVRGDATTPFQEIVEVIDACQQAGIWNISFATQRPETGN